NAITAIGGGAKNNLWVQMMADIYNLPVHVPHLLEEASSLGAAIAAGVGVGVYQDLNVVKQFIHTDHTMTPKPKNHAIYEELISLFKQSYHQLLPIYDQLAKFNA
ncbi:MAG: FGGY-family carbohydrate kinase, partial [Cellulosilyticaceae bacterium]